MIGCPERNDLLFLSTDAAQLWSFSSQMRRVLKVRKSRASRATRVIFRAIRRFSACRDRYPPLRGGVGASHEMSDYVPEGLPWSCISEWRMNVSPKYLRVRLHFELTSNHLVVPESSSPARDDRPQPLKALCIELTARHKLWGL